MGVYSKAAGFRAIFSKKWVWQEHIALKAGGCGEKAPFLYRDPVLHFHAPRLIALRGGDRNEETPTTEKEGEVHAPCLRTCTQPTKLFAAGAQLAAHTQPALRTGPMAPALRLLRAFPESNS